MSEVISHAEAPVCKPTKWFLWRALAMLAMFSVFGVLFLKDGLWGYKEENLHYFYKQAFDKAGEQFQEMRDDDAFNEAVWREHAAQQEVPFPDEAELMLPEGTDIPARWPQELIDGYATMIDKGGQPGAQKIWEDFTKEKSWDAVVGHKAHTPWKIKEQFLALGVCVVLALITLFFLVRTMGRKITADEEALHTQDGRRIPYADMVRVDKRKWDTKGLALIYYRDGGEEKKAKIDGMVYGQFKEEDGAPAEKLFSYLMERFKGEVIEYADDEEENESDSGESHEQAEEKKQSDS